MGTNRRTDIIPISERPKPGIGEPWDSAATREPRETIVRRNVNRSLPWPFNKRANDAGIRILNHQKYWMGAAGSSHSGRIRPCVSDGMRRTAQSAVPRGGICANDQPVGDGHDVSQRLQRRC